MATTGWTSGHRRYSSTANYQGDKSLSVLRNVVNAFDMLVPIEQLHL